MSETQISDIYSRLENLTRDVNSLKIQAGTISTSQMAIAEILTMITTLTTEARSSRADIRSLQTDMSDIKSDVAEILRILRDRNGGTGI